MYILIDTDRNIAVAKHPNFQVLCDLGILECSESSYVMPLEGASFEAFDDIQLQMLYINVTKNDSGALYPRKIICNILHYYFNHMQEFKADAKTTSLQAEYAIDNGLEGSCRYQPNRSVPFVDGNTSHGYCTILDTVKETQIEQGEKVVTDMGQQAAFSAPRETTAPTAPGSSERSTAPRASGTRDTIYAAADAAWAAVGNTTDKSVILKMRKQIMDELEAQGLKRNTVSNTLGAWQKERVCQ